MDSAFKMLTYMVKNTEKMENFSKPEIYKKNQMNTLKLKNKISEIIIR